MHCKAFFFALVAVSCAAAHFDESIQTDFIESYVPADDSFEAPVADLIETKAASKVSGKAAANAKTAAGWGRRRRSWHLRRERHNKKIARERRIKHHRRIHHERRSKHNRRIHHERRGKGFARKRICQRRYRNVCHWAPASCSVTVYKHCNYRGYRINLKPGSYNMRQLMRKGMKNDDLSSIRVHGRCVAKLYQHWNFGGKVMTKTRSDSCFTNDRMYIPVAQLHQIVIHALPEPSKKVAKKIAKEAKSTLAQTKAGWGRRRRRSRGRRARRFKSWNDQVSSIRVHGRRVRRCYKRAYTHCYWRYVRDEKTQKALVEKKAKEAKKKERSKKREVKAKEGSAKSKERHDKESKKKERSKKREVKAKEGSAKAKERDDKESKKKERSKKREVKAKEGSAKSKERDDKESKKKERSKKREVKAKEGRGKAKERDDKARKPKTYDIVRGSCVAWGDPHIKPLTGSLFDIQREGVYTALKYGQFKVQTWHTICGRRPGFNRHHQVQGLTGKYRVSCGKGWAVQLADGLVFSASARSPQVKLNGSGIGRGRKTFKGSRVLIQGSGYIHIENKNFVVSLNVGRNIHRNFISIGLRNKSLLGKLSGFCGGGHEYAGKGCKGTHLRFPCRDCIRGGLGGSKGLCECKNYFHGSNQNPHTLFPPTDHVKLVSWKKRIQKNLKPNPARFNTFVRQCKDAIHTGHVGKWAHRIGALRRFIDSGAKSCAFDKYFGAEHNVRAQFQSTVCGFVKSSIRFSKPSTTWCQVAAACKMRANSHLQKACAKKLELQ